jgi:ferredoxin
MIVGQRKPITEIWDMIAPHGRVLVLGCGGCVTVCNSGGRKEVGVLAAALSLAASRAGQKITLDEKTLERQCDPEYLEELRPLLDKYDAILSLACGAGVQFVAERYLEMPCYPALNTTFIGVALGNGVWAEYCAACGNCLLALTGGVCPVARCAKRLFNGPCGGSSQGECEIRKDTACAWQLVYDKLKALGKLDRLENFIPPKDWSTNKDGGPRKYTREDLAI